MSANALPILPSTKVADLLDRYPQLEDLLIALAPPFKKLKNPILRKSVAKVVSLQQAAAVGGISISMLVNRLRAAVGQEAIAFDDVTKLAYYSEHPPRWFDATRIVTSVDERGNSNPDKMPIAAVLQRAVDLRPAEILELITTFLPAPGIDILRGKGFLVWSLNEGPEIIRTYVLKHVEDELVSPGHDG